MSDRAQPPEMPLGKLIPLVSAQAAVLVALGLTLWWFAGRAVADFVTVETDGFTSGLLLAAGMIAVAAAIFYPFQEFTDKLVRLQGETYSFLKDRLPMWAIVWISICAGVGEEALFRGGMQVLLYDYFGPIAAIAVSSAIFAIVHMAKPIVAVLIFAIGVLFGVIYWQTGSLLTVMVGHAIYDVFALAYLQRRLHELDYFAERPAEKEVPDAAN